MHSESSDMTGMPEERKAEATEAPSAFVRTRTPMSE